MIVGETKLYTNRLAEKFVQDDGFRGISPSLNVKTVEAGNAFVGLDGAYDKRVLAERRGQNHSAIFLCIH
jgi:hypothetical protein